MKRIDAIFLKALPLSLGLALSIVLIAKICFDLSYDSFYNDVDRIYAIRTGLSREGEAADYANISGAVAPGFRQYVPGVEEATRITGIFDSNKYYTEDRQTIASDGSIVCADTSFFRIFNRKILAGNPEEVLMTPLSLMVSESFAEKLGGAGLAVGKKIRNSDMPDLEMTVGGVYEDFPKNSMHDIDLMLSMVSYSSQSTENWVGNDRYNGYVKLQEGVDPSSLTGAIRLMQEKNQPIEEFEKNGLKIWYYLTPLDRLHTGDRNVRSSMILFAIVSLLLISISVLNYMLSTVTAFVERSKSFATRKCFGAEWKDIYGVLFREALVTVGAAVLMAAVILAAGRGIILNIMGVTLESMLVPLSYAVIAAVVVIVLLFTALVPGYIYMNVPIAAAMRRFNDTRYRWKYILLISQFTINVFLFGMLGVVMAQYGKVMNGDPGYEYRNVLYAYTGGLSEQNVETAMNSLSGVTGVESMIRMSYLPFEPSSGNNIYLPGSDKELFNIADQYFATESFFTFFDVPIIEGREPLSPGEVAVSRSFVEKMREFADWSDGAVGKSVLVTEHSQSLGPDEAFTVSGVYEDYVIGSLNNMDERPSVRFFGVGGRDYLSYLLIKVDRITPEVLDAVDKALSDAAPEGLDIEVMSYEEQMKNLYSDNRKMRDTFVIGCLLALFISVFGLIGYIGNEASRRSKEIAIRKINGATAADIVAMFVKDSLKMSAIAVILGDVLMWFAASRYLEQFPERVSLNALYFVAADVLLLVIVMVTVIVNCVKISVSNPVDSIKNE